MKVLILAFGALLLSVVSARAQSPIIIGPNSQLVWDIAAPDVATAQALVYTVTVDALAPKVLSPVTCVPAIASGVQTCGTLVSQIPTGSHTVTLTSTSGGLVSLPSAPFTYLDLLIPVPTSLRLK